MHTEVAAVVANRALVLTAVLIAGCTAGAPSSPAPSTGATATAAATSGFSPEGTTAPVGTTTPVAPSPTTAAACRPGGPTTAFQRDSIVCVVAGQLHVGPGPDETDGSEAFEPLQAGQLLFVIDGPVQGSESTWYLVERTPGGVERADGWVPAAAPDGTPWLAAASMQCPEEPSLVDLAAMDATQRLHCYHAREFTFTDTVVAGPMCGDGVVLKSPTWMASCQSTFSWGTQSSLVLAIPPELADDVGSVELPDGSVQATVTAHMDDAAALTCEPHEGFEADYELLEPGMVLMCRTMFVATSFQRVTP